MKKLTISLLAAAFLCAANAHAFIVKLNATSDGSDRPTISGTTNMPDGTKVMLTVSRKQNSYMAQSTVSVKSGKFQSEPFTDRYAPLNPGMYTVEISTSMASLQPPETWPTIGKDGEKMEGPLAKKSQFGGKGLRYSTTFKVGSGAPSKKQDQKSKVDSEKAKASWVIDACIKSCNIKFNGANPELGRCVQACATQ